MITKLLYGSEILLFKDWLKESRRMLDSSIYVYVNVMKLFFIENTDIDDIEQYNWFIANYTHKKRCTHYYSVIKSYIQFRYKDDVKRRDDMLEKLIHPKQYKDIKMERQYIPQDKSMEVINNISDDKHRVMAIIQMLTGVRAGDVLSLRRGSVFFERYEERPVMRLVVLGKGEKRNVVYLFDTIAMSIVDDYIGRYDSFIESNNGLIDRYFEDYLFITYGRMRGRSGDPTSKNKMIRMNYLRYWWDVRNAVKKSGVVDVKFFSTHDFRRCLARDVWSKYKDVNVLQRVLNHEDPSTTLRYLKQSGLQNIDIFKDIQTA